MGDPVGIVSRNGQRHLVVANQDVRVMLDRFRVLSHLFDELHRSDKVIKGEGALDLAIELDPFAVGFELCCNLLFVQLDECLLGHGLLLRAFACDPSQIADIQFSSIFGCPKHPVYPQSSVREPIIPNHSTRQEITRLAPSPTGALHLGNALSFVINWSLARKHNWHIALRIEDLDTPRVKPGVIEQTIRTLEWLGLDWDSRPTTQASQIDLYRQAMEKLTQNQCVYPCELTRSQIEQAATAPHADERNDLSAHETRFTPDLRPQCIPNQFNDASTNWRFVVNPGSVGFADTHMGGQSFDLDAILGDFVVWTKRGTPSYQLAVVVDDARAGVTQIVRGNDLLDSASRQLMLYRALGISDEPTYTHLPLVRGSDGCRLAKRHGDTRIDSYTQSGTRNERVIGLLAFWCRITQERVPMSIEEFQDGFSLDTLPTDDIVFTPEDDAWLRS